MFSNYATELETPEGPLSVMGPDSPVPFDIDELSIKDRPWLTRAVDLHIELTDLVPGEPYTITVKKTPLSGFIQTKEGVAWVKSTPGATSICIHVLDPQACTHGFTVVGDAGGYRLDMPASKDAPLTIVSNERMPDTFIQITVVWGPTDKLLAHALID